jgi:hypothetical protein
VDDDIDGVIAEAKPFAVAITAHRHIRPIITPRDRGDTTRSLGRHQR